jgi:hypothetical protein
MEPIDAMNWLVSGGEKGGGLVDGCSVVSTAGCLGPWKAPVLYRVPLLSQAPTLVGGVQKGEPSLFERAGHPQGFPHPTALFHHLEFS